MIARLMQFAAAGQGDKGPPRFAIMDTAGSGYGKGLVSKSSGEVYITGSYYLSLYCGLAIRCGWVDDAFDVAWQRQISNGAEKVLLHYGEPAKRSSDGALLVLGYTYAASAKGVQFAAQLTESGNLIAAHRGYPNSYYSGFAYSGAFISDGIAVWGEVKEPQIATITSSIYVRAWSGSSPGPLALGSDGYLYLTCSYSNVRIIIYDPTSGSIVATHDYAYTGGVARNPKGIKIAANGTIYMLCAAGSSYYPHLLALDSNGNILWQRYWPNDTNYSYSSLALDSLDQPVVRIKNKVFKYDSTGNILWQRELSVYGGQLEAITVADDGALWLTGYVNYGGTKLFWSRLPGDGSDTGVYGPFAWDEIIETDATGLIDSHTAATPTNDSSTSLTTLTPGLTDFDCELRSF